MYLFSRIAKLLAVGLGFSALSSAGKVVCRWDIVRLEGSSRITINGAERPPVVNTTSGDTLVIHTRNFADQPIQLVVHDGTPHRRHSYWDDAVEPFSNMTYRFVMKNPGTHWISVRQLHPLVEYAEFPSAPLLVQSKHEIYDYGKEHVLLFEELDSQLLVNGQSIAANALPRLRVDPYWVYRIRLINLAPEHLVSLSIDEHELSLIEVNGIEYALETARKIALLPGQRKSVLVTAKPYNNLNYNYRVSFKGEGYSSAAGIVEYWPGAPTKAAAGQWDTGKQAGKHCTQPSN